MAKFIHVAHKFLEVLYPFFVRFVISNCKLLNKSNAFDPVIQREGYPAGMAPFSNDNGPPAVGFDKTLEPRAGCSKVTQSFLRIDLVNDAQKKFVGQRLQAEPLTWQRGLLGWSHSWAVNGAKVTEFLFLIHGRGHVQPGETWVMS